MSKIDVLPHPQLHLHFQERLPFLQCIYVFERELQIVWMVLALDLGFQPDLSGTGYLIYDRSVADKVQLSALW